MATPLSTGTAAFVRLCSVEGCEDGPEEGKRWLTRLRFLSHKRSQIPVCRVQDIGVPRDDNLRLSLKRHQTAIHLASLTRCQQEKKKNVMSLLTGREAGADFLPLSLAFFELSGADADARPDRPTHCRQSQRGTIETFRLPQKPWGSFSPSLKPNRSVCQQSRVRRRRDLWGKRSRSLF